MKILRRSIIVVCFILIMPFIIAAISNLAKGKYYSKGLKALVKDGQAQVIEINEKVSIDGDSIYIERIINTDSETNLRYRTLEKPGWSFPESALALYDDKGRKQMHGSAASSGPFGQNGVISYDRIDKDSKKIIIKLEWYDRSGEVVVPAHKGGDK